MQSMVYMWWSFCLCISMVLLCLNCIYKPIKKNSNIQFLNIYIIGNNVKETVMFSEVGIMALGNRGHHKENLQVQKLIWGLLFIHHLNHHYDLILNQSWTHHHLCSFLRFFVFLIHQLCQYQECLLLDYHTLTDHNHMNSHNKLFHS